MQDAMRLNQRSTTITVPIIAYPAVWHVGTMHGPPIQPSSGYEARHLSVSRCPEAWTRIARIGERPTYELRPTSGHASFLDVLRMDAPSKRSIFKAAAADGNLRMREAWRAVVGYDENTDEPLESIYETYEEAEIESVDPDDDPPRTTTFAFASESLMTRVGGTEPKLGEDYALMAMAEDAGFDGLWWREAYRPQALSAPRGCILQSRVANWSQTKLASCPDDREADRARITHRTITLMHS